MSDWHKRKLLEQKIKSLMLPKIASEDPWLNFKDQRSEQKPAHTDEQEDPWTKEKYDRGGEEEYQKYLKNPAPYVPDENEEPIQKALPVGYKGKDISTKVADQIGTQNDFEVLPELKDMDLTKLYRAYKNTPHRPEALLLKYMVHRLENHDKYENPETGKKLDEDFMDLHQKGKAKEKNGHIIINDLHRGIVNNVKAMQQLVDHRAKLHKFIKENLPENLIDINGKAHVGLTRGLGVGKGDRGEEHSLASYADIPNTGFGYHMHHQHVPLENLWFSYDLGPKKASSEKYGPENEFLISPHKITYSSDHESNYVFGEPKTTRLFPKKLYTTKKSPELDKEIFKFKLNNSTLGPEYLHSLAQTNVPDSSIHESIASKSHTGPETLHYLAQTNRPDSGVHQILANNPNTKQETLHYLAQTNKPDSDTHIILARNRNLSQETQRFLAQVNKSDSSVHEKLAGNQNINLDVAHHLAQANKPDSIVHSLLSLRSNLNPETYHHLAQTNTPGSDVHWQLDMNSSYQEIKKPEKLASSMSPWNILELAKSEDHGHPALNGQPHAIMSLENPKHPVSSSLSHDQQMKHMQTLGSGVEAIRGNYDGPENSFIIHNPKSIDQVKQFAHSLGQDSIISSSGGNHQMHFLHGPDAGKVVTGQGHVSTDQKPDNYYSEIPTTEGMKYVTYNFDFDKMTKDELPGGKGDTKKPSDFDPDEFEMGLEVESEHTGDHDIAAEIVADHLTEDPRYYTKLKGSGLADELTKGAMKRVAPFNPVKDVSEGHRKLLDTWVNDSDDRHLVPPLTGAAKTRGMVKLYKDAISRKNPDTNEREYLLFRGKTGHDHKNGDKLSGLTSFSPDPNVAEGFNIRFKVNVSPQAVINGYPPHHELAQAAQKVKEHNLDSHAQNIDNFLKAKENHLGGVYASWVPESAIHHIPNAVGQMEGKTIGPNEYENEKEVIVNASHPNFKHVKLGSEHMDLVHQLYKDHLAKQPKIVKSEDIFKAFLHNGNWRPEPTDPDGMPHPDPNKPYVKGTDSDSNPGWTYRPDIVETQEKDFMQNYNNAMRGNKFSPEGKKHLHALSKQILSDPDRHMIGTLRQGQQVARLRHLNSALKGQNGYSIKEHQNGLLLSADRHPGTKNTETSLWHFDGAKLNNLK